MTDDEGTASSTGRDLYLTLEQSKETPIPEASRHSALSPFGKYSTCKTRQEIMDKVCRLIFDHLNKDNKAKASLIPAFESYFEAIGIESNNDLAVMQDSDWQMSDQDTDQRQLKNSALCCFKW